MNKDFWDYLDELVASTSIITDRPKGSSHPLYPHIRYPINYGYLDGSKSGDGSGIDVWIGSMPVKDIVGILVTVDLRKMDSEIKILIGCSETEIILIQGFQNTEQMKSLIIRRQE